MFRILVLMYHGTPNRTPESIYSLRSNLFIQHLKYLKRNNWNSLLISDLNQVNSFQDRNIIITFDDGYADNYDGAFIPLLEYNMNATWFISTDFIGKYAYWMGAPSKETEMLSVEQLQEMSISGMEIGSHTCSHPDLSMLPFDEQLRELTESKAVLENILSRPVSSLAYPFGKYNSDSIKAAQMAPYSFACSTHSGSITREINPMLIRRITIYSNDSVSALHRKLTFATNDASWRNASAYYLSRIKARFNFSKQ